MKVFTVVIKNGAQVIARYEAMASDRFACVVQNMDTAHLLGGYAVAYPVEVK